MESSFLVLHKRDIQTNGQTELQAQDEQCGWGASKLKQLCPYAVSNVRNSAHLVFPVVDHRILHQVRPQIKFRSNTLLNVKEYSLIF